MLGFSPFRFYYYMWKYFTPCVLLALLVASAIQLGMTPPSYNAWIEELVSTGKALVTQIQAYDFLFVFLSVYLFP